MGTFLYRRSSNALTVWCALIALSACVAEVVEGESSDVGLVQQPFIEKWSSSSNSPLMGAVFGPMRVCVRIDGSDPYTLEDRKFHVRTAIGKWLAPLRRVSWSALVQTVELTCSSPHSTITFHGRDGRSETNGANIDMYFDVKPSSHVLLHEIGHQFGFDEGYEGFDVCKLGQIEGSVMCQKGSPTELHEDDKFGVQEIFCTRYPSQCKRRWQANLGWCYGNTQLLIGDVNGDGRDDLICHDRAGGRKWVARADTSGAFTGTTWEAAFPGWCTDPSQLYVGKFNQDAFADLLCNDPASGKKWILFGSSNGSFSGGDIVWNDFWCGAPDKLFIGDFNGDGRDDLLCHGVSAGQKWTALAQPNGTFVHRWGGLNFCSAQNAEIKIGNFDGIKGDDILCNDRNTSRVLIEFSNGDGTFGGRNWISLAEGHCDTSWEQLEIGDFDFDGRDDMLCHTTGGNKQVFLAKSDGTFVKGAARIWYPGWCTHTNGRLMVGNFNTGSTDILCHDVANGTKWIMFSPDYRSL